MPEGGLQPPLTGWPNSNWNRRPISLWIRRPISFWNARPNSNCNRRPNYVGIRNNWSKDFLEAGKKRLSGDTARQATSGEVVSLKREARDLKEVLAETLLENRLLKKSMIADGDDPE